MNSKLKFWDRDGDGDFDIVDLFWILLQAVGYGGGAIFLLTTFTRSYHLLSSPQMNPDVFWWWPYLTSAAPEVGLFLSWLSCEVGVRKGKIEFTGLGIIGAVVFFFVVGIMQLYDVALVRGGDLSGIRDIGNVVAALLPLATIFYAGTVTAMLGALDRAEKIRRGVIRIDGRTTVLTNHSSHRLGRMSQSHDEEDDEEDGIALPNPIVGGREMSNMRGTKGRGNGRGESFPTHPSPVVR